jgi:hypothetical protein
LNLINKVEEQAKVDINDESLDMAVRNRYDEIIRKLDEEIN